METIQLPYQIKKIEKNENDNINFSIIIITKNDDKYIHNILNDLKEFKEMGGEILFVDIGSTDDTAEIIRNSGYNIENVNMYRNIDDDMFDIINNSFKRDNDNIVNIGDSYIDYSNLRDYSSSLVNNDMILMINSRSKLLNFNINELITFINNGFDLLSFTIHNNSDNNINAFYNKRKYKWNNLIYEELNLYNDNNVQTGILPDHILLIENLNNDKKYDNDIIPLSIDCFLNPNNVKLLEKFAISLMEYKHYNSSIDMYNLYIDKGNIGPHIKSKIYTIIGDIMLEIGRNDEFVDYYNKAYKVYSKWRTPLYKLAEYYFETNEIDKSIFYAKGCLDINKPDIDMEENEFYYQDGPYSILYVSYWWANNKEKGKYYFDKALEISPRNSIYLSETNYHYEYGGNIIDGNLSFQELQYLYKNTKDYKSILEINPERGRSTHAIISSNSNIVTILNHNIDKNDIVNNLNNPCNLRFVDNYEIDNEKFELIVINCSNLSYDDLKELINKYQFKSTKMIIGYNYNVNKEAVDHTLEIDGVFENIWYKKISNYEKKTIYIKKEI